MRSAAAGVCVQESEYQDALIIKSIVFEALNNFYLLIFILFMKIPRSMSLFGQPLPPA